MQLPTAASVSETHASSSVEAALRVINPIPTTPDKNTTSRPMLCCAGLGCAGLCCAVLQRQIAMLQAEAGVAEEDEQEVLALPAPGDCQEGDSLEAEMHAAIASTEMSNFAKVSWSPYQVAQS